MTGLRELLLGFAIAAAPGPMGLLCLDRSLRRGIHSGLATGLGTAAADGLYALLGSLGTAGLTRQAAALGDPLRLLGGGLLLYLGWKALTSSSTAADSPKDTSRGSFAGDALSSFALTVANPITILSMGALFATTKPAGARGLPYALAFAGYLFLGSLAWWILLSCSAHASRRVLPSGALRFLQKGTAAVLLGLGAWGCLSVLR